MRRSVLLTLAALGAMVSLVGGAGLFAALNDSARTGVNSAESAALSASADIQLATAGTSQTTPGLVCDDFADNLTTPFLSLSDISPGYQAGNYFCLRNVGSQAVNISASADELTDVDIACTGDEVAHGDETCGENLAGELAAVVDVSYTDPVCSDPASGSSVNVGLDTNATTPHGLGALDPGATRCFYSSLIYPLDTPAVAVQRAQSDKVTWRFRFSAVAAG